MKRAPFKRKTPQHQPAVERDPKPLAKATRRGVISRCDGASPSQAKEPAPVRDEAHRRRVAALPCFHCRIEGHSQAAHPNSGKARGKKLSDLLCFPLCCDRPGVVGCHTNFDQYRLVPSDQMANYEVLALAWTSEQLKEKA